MLNTQFGNNPIEKGLTRSQRVSIAKFEAYKIKANSLEHLDFVRDHKQRIQNLINNTLNSEELSERNKDFIKNRYLELQAKGDSLETIRNKIFYPSNLVKNIKKDLDKVDSKDLKIFFASLLEKGRSNDNYIKPYKQHLTRFYLWFNGLDELETPLEKFPEVVKWIGIIRRNYSIRNPDEVLSVEDIYKMAKVSTNPRDSAIHLCLFELGCRSQEFLRLKRSDVKFDKKGAIIKVLSGKAKKYKESRKLRVISCVPALKKWYEMSPADRPEDPLWISIGSHILRPLSKSGFCKIIKKDGRLAQVSEKKCFPHSYRHGRCYDLLSKGFTDKDLRLWFAWSEVSNMPSIYSSAYGLEDVQKKILKLNGMLTEEEEKEDSLKPRKCVRCGCVNTPTNNYCEKCFMALDLKTVMANDEKIRIADVGYERAVEKSGGFCVDKSLLKEVIKDMIKSGEIVV